MVKNVYFLLIIGLNLVRAERKDTLIEAENMLGDISEIHHRSNASGLKSVHLNKGDYIETELCLMPHTELVIKEIVYSNDGPSDRIRISLDSHVVGEFETVTFTDMGKGWDIFRPYRSFFTYVTEGRHVLKLTVLQSDAYGVEIDNIKIEVNHSMALDSLSCDAFCFKENNFPYFKPKVPPTGSARAVQRSVRTKCAEEDNVNIPVFHDGASNLDFEVTASLPKYRSFQNNRGADWTNCQMMEAFWKYQDVSFNRDKIRNTSTSHLMNITGNLSSHGVAGLSLVSTVEVEFDLDGPSTGSTDSEIGTIVHLENIRCQGKLKLSFQYINRYNKWSKPQRKKFKCNVRSIKFRTPDFSFREGNGNKIRIDIYSDQNSSDEISVGNFYMSKRWLRSDKITTLYKDGLTVIEGVDMDMWWRINETMSVSIARENSTFENVDYIRVYRRVAWTEDGYSQVFVLYQDANIRLLPTTPHGLDWIPFGSSVIIGQTDPLSNRPFAPISHLDIDPDTLKLTIYYTDGSVIHLQIQTTLSQTKLHVVGTHFVKDVNLYPFFTFRSMYVADDNNDADHISVDGGKPMKIVEQWNELRGNYFAFFRQCISKHNTQSPDISIHILS